MFDEIKTGMAAIEAELESTVQDKPKRAPRPRKGFAAHLERVEIVTPEIPAGCEGLEKVLIGEDVSERLDVMPAKFRVIVTRRPKYAYRNRDGVIQAPAPPHIIESGIPTEALLAQIAVSKYADGLPLYRQEAIYARDQVELDRSLMAQWMGKVGFELQPLADYVLERIKQGERIFADETTLPTLAPGSGKTLKAWLWAYARDDRPFGGAGPPMVAYRFEDSRSGDCVARHLAGFSGLLQVDGYAAYNRLAKGAGANDGDPGRLFCPCQKAILRTACERKLAAGDADDHDNGSTLEGRRGHPRQGSRNTGESPPGKVHRRCGTALRLVGNGTAAPVREIQTRRGDSLRPLPAGRSRTLPERWACRNRFQHCESLCTPSSSVCKHWKRVRVNNATRATFPGHRRFDRLRRQVVGTDLMRCAGNNLHSRKDTGLDKTPYRVVCDA